MILSSTYIKNKRPKLGYLFSPTQRFDVSYPNISILKVKSKKETGCFTSNDIEKTMSFCFKNEKNKTEIVAEVLHGQW